MSQKPKLKLVFDVTGNVEINLTFICFLYPQKYQNNSIFLVKEIEKRFTKPDFIFGSKYKNSHLKVVIIIQI